MEKKDRETFVDKCRIYLRDDNILHVTIVGDMTEKIVERCMEATEKLQNMAEGEVPGRLIDLNEAKNVPLAARDAGKRSLERKNEGKVAFYVEHTAAKMLASFMVSISNKKDIGVFSSEEEAIVWIKKKD